MQAILEAVFPYLKELVVLAVSTAVSLVITKKRHKIFKPKNDK